LRIKDFSKIFIETREKEKENNQILIFKFRAQPFQALEKSWLA